jgi:hypothetical protein
MLVAGQGALGGETTQRENDEGAREGELGILHLGLQGMRAATVDSRTHEDPERFRNGTMGIREVKAARGEARRMRSGTFPPGTQA